MGYNLSKPFLRAQLEEDLKRCIWRCEVLCAHWCGSWDCRALLNIWFAAPIGFVMASLLRMVSGVCGESVPGGSELVFPHCWRVMQCVVVHCTHVCTT